MPGPISKNRKSALQNISTTPIGWLDLFPDWSGLLTHVAQVGCVYDQHNKHG